MKKIIVCFLFGIMFLLTGCNKEKDIIDLVKNKIEKNASYLVNGELEIVNNENIYKYDVEVAYKKDDNFKVTLKNKTNDHEQIILKNDTGVYVLTPSLNKSFKFQSEWPYNNSQSYLLQNILEDILNDDEKTIEKNKNKYIITTKVNYPNNKELSKQKVYINENGNIEKVEVMNENDISKIKMKFNKIEYKNKFDNKFFDLAENINTDKSEVTLSEIEDTIYPMYLPENTFLSNEEKVSLDNGERIILTFEGDEPFTIIEETALYDSGKTEEVYGDIEILTDVFGYINDGIASWISNGIEYYAVSKTMNEEQLLKVINSISVIPVGK